MKWLKISILCRFVTLVCEKNRPYNQKFNTFGLFFYSPKCWESFIKSKFEKGTWFMSPQGGFVLKIHKVQGNKFIFSSWVNKVRCNKVTATIKKNGKNATAKFKCKNGKMHYLDFTWIKNGVRIKENSSCYNKLLSPLGQSGNKVTASFYTESYWYAHMY